MNKCIVMMALIAVGISFAEPMFADDAPSAPPVQTKKQLMQSCMADEKSKNPQASQNDLTKICRKKMQSYRDHPSVTTPANAPVN